MARSGRTGDQPIVESAHAEKQPCASCGSTNVLKIRMKFEGSPVHVLVCADCESRTWSQDGKPIEMSNVLPALRRSRRNSDR